MSDETKRDWPPPPTAGEWRPPPAGPPPGPTGWTPPTGPPPGPAGWTPPGGSPSGPPGWAPAGPPGYAYPAPPARGSNRTAFVVIAVVVVLLLLLLGVAVILLAGGLGSLGERTPLTEVAVGQCFDGIQASDFSGDAPQLDLAALLGVTLVDCSMSHQGELIGRVFYGGGTFPGDQQMEAFAVDSCRDAFQDYVGRSFDLSALEMTYFYPQRASWNQGDRAVECIAHPPPGVGKESGSVRDSRR